jgi:tRNA(His) 5'-end guanylyltransferase
MGNDNLGDRMKEYENCFKQVLTNNIDYIIRLDGRHFHTLTRGMEKPFDYFFIECMRNTASRLLKEVQGAKLVYVQSDEISIYITNKQSETAEMWFGNKLQKIISVSASFATMVFNENLSNKYDKKGMFDSRMFAIPSNEIANYFIWRQRDWERNSVSMFCSSMYSHKDMHRKNKSQMHEMIHKKGYNWNDLDNHIKNGTFYFVKDGVLIEVTNKLDYSGLNNLIQASLE